VLDSDAFRLVELCELSEGEGYEQIVSVHATV
jgi:hypothetical protein